MADKTLISKLLLINVILEESNPFQVSIAFHIKTSHFICNDRFLFEMQCWAEMG